METSESREATVDLDIDAPVEQVWEALTSDQGWSDWMGEGSVVGQGVGDELFAVDPVTGEPKHGEIDEFDEGQRLGYHWWPEADPDQTSHVSITLTPCESGTRVTVVETAPGVAVCSGQMSAVALATSTVGWTWRAALLSVMARPATVGMPVRA